MNTTRSLRPIALILLTFFLGSLFLAANPTRRALAGTIIVNSVLDEYNNNGSCSLREAITAANTDTAVDSCQAGSGTDTILLPGALIFTSLSGAGEDGNLTGDYDIYTDMNFEGQATIDGDGLDRVFHIFNGATVQFNGATIQNGNPGGGFAGGNILNYGGHLTLINSQVLFAHINGGIYATTGSTLTILNSRMASNVGRGVISSGTAFIRDSTISANVMDTANGGGIFNGGTLTVINSTISGNISFDSGGGLSTNGVVHLDNVTITNNRADSDENLVGDGGGVYVVGAGNLTVRNSIIAGNTDGSNPAYSKPDCFGPLTSEGFNLTQNITGCTISGDTTGNLTGLDAMLGPLQDNGGPTFTHALLAGSPAIDAGDPGGCLDQDGSLLAMDQRGYVRNGRCDMGAFEYNSLGTPTPTSSVLPSSVLYLPVILRPGLSSSGTSTSTPVGTATSTPTSVVNGSPSPTATAMRTATPTQDSTPQGPTPTPIEGYGYINILDYEYQPALITIHAGRIVTWENFGLVDHSVTSDTGVFDSGTLAPGAKFQYTFSTVGNYPYHCTFYPGMTGMVIVLP